MKLELPKEVKQALIQLINSTGPFNEGDNLRGIVEGGKTEDGSYYVRFEFRDSEINEFKKYLNDLDDEIFLESCERFTKVNGKEAFDKMDSYMKNESPEVLELIKDFKDCVSSVIRDKINKLQRFLN